jgi:4-diphosphocytidyl-2-C-methyl-D-erythritol kinase
MSTGSGVARRLAPAKTNLWLAVHGARKDGFHELSTLMLALDWGDELRARTRPAAGVALHLSGPAASADVPADERNLAWRAAALALGRAAELGLQGLPGVELELLKRVPSQAGLGGGSSDAVAALLLVEELLGLDLGREWRRDQCARLGADCSFFLELGTSGLALCEGAGERVTPWEGPPPPWWVALIVPALQSSTGRVFASLRTFRPARATCPFDAGLAELPLTEVRARLGTDLEAAALAALPELGEWRALLDAVGAGHFRLSGSGSSFFGLFADPGEARVELETLRRAADAAGLRLRQVRLARPWPGAPQR